MTSRTAACSPMVLSVAVMEQATDARAQSAVAQGEDLVLVTRLASVLRAVAMGLAIACILYAIALVAVLDGSLFALATDASAAPFVVMAAFCAASAWTGSRSRASGSTPGLLLLLGVLFGTLLVSWPRGALAFSWYVQPILALLAATAFGTLAGLGVAAASIATLLLCTHWTHVVDLVDPAALWAHGASLSAIILACALTGALVHALLLRAFQTAAENRASRARVEQQLAQGEKLLRHALRVETVGDLAGLVSHQLRNAHQVMAGHVAMAELGQSGERGHRLRLIGEVLEQSKPLLDQLMGLAHPGDGDLVELDLGSLLASFHHRARQILPSSIELGCRVADEDLAVRLNARGFEHALWNLVINARQAIDGQGAIDLHARIEQGEVVLDVVDTGCGMPPEVAARVFEPYFTTKPIGQGTGLGLVAVERFVRTCGGRIEVESTHGKGTRFRLSLPQAHAAVRTTGATG